MNKFNSLLLGTTALTFVSLAQSQAATITETTDFGNSFGSRSFLGPASSGALFATTDIFGSVNTLDGGLASASGQVLDHLDFFTLSGLTAFQAVTINLLPASGTSGPDASASASASASSSDDGSGGSAFPNSFAITLLDNSGSFLNFVGDSFPDATASGSGTSGGGASASSGDLSSASSGGTTPATLNFADSFTFDATALSTGNLNFRIEGGLDLLQNYQLTVTPVAEADIDEPSTLAGIAVGAAGLGFLSARRRRRRK